EDRGAAARAVARAARVLADLGRLDGAFADAASPLDAAAANIEEGLLAVRKLREGIDAEPGRLEAIDERLDAITRLKRKYGDSEAAMLEFHKATIGDLERLPHHDEVVATEERGAAERLAQLPPAAPPHSTTPHDT